MAAVVYSMARSSVLTILSRAWGSEGLESWEVTQFEQGNPYMIQATLKFESLKKWENASTGPSSSRVFGDMPNFTTVQPQVMRGAVKGSHRTSLKEKKIFGS